MFGCQAETPSSIFYIYYYYLYLFIYIYIFFYIYLTQNYHSTKLWYKITIAYQAHSTFASQIPGS